MENLFEELGRMGRFFETQRRAEAYEKNGIEGLYKEMMQPKAKAKRGAKKETGKEWNETAFELAYIHSKIDNLIDLLKWASIGESEKDRKVIADELRNLANELESIK